MKKVFIFLAIIPFIAIAQNQDSVFIKKISDDVFVNGKAYNLLRELTKNIGGRLAGSPQFAKAVVWGKKSLENLGADNVYLQECMVPHWIRSQKEKVIITEQNGEKVNILLDALALGNSWGSNGKPIVAEVIAVKDFAELEKRKDEIKGKIVFYNYPFNPTYIFPGQAYGESGVYRRNGASRAAKYGAVAVLVRSLTEATNNNPHTGTMTYNDSFPKIPALALGLYDADKLWKEAVNGKVKISVTSSAKFLPDTIAHNVIAELKGTEFPNQYITVGGHLDSWDVNEGAHDDGTGIVQTMEILRVLKALNYKPKHTLRFVLFANEENGMRGANKYAEEAKANNEQHIFALESDNGGFTPRGFSLGMSNEKIAKIKTWANLLKPYGCDNLELGGGGADVAPLQRNMQTPVAELRPDNQRYFDIHHARSDVFENVNKRELLLGAVNMAALIYLIDKYGL
ncbi:MAG: M20/M25/M40 family metallo-hydrolase [Bacteroidetes bacterium]|nr:M20/M25/M40 family metallo-hydrolase [Bacteroidota bacterium]MBS1670967.1 M20/M25/M40 family metallo-hydrolase [Bacteroidota bacterium]